MAWLAKAFIGSLLSMVVASLLSYVYIWRTTGANEVILMHAGSHGEQMGKRTASVSLETYTRWKHLSSCFSSFTVTKHPKYGLGVLSMPNTSFDCRVRINNTYTISFRVVRYIAATVFLVESLNPWDLNTTYIAKMRTAGAYPGTERVCQQLSSEYEVLVYLSETSSTRSRTSAVYKDAYPMLHWQMNGLDSCLIFMQHLDGYVPLFNFLPSHFPHPATVVYSNVSEFLMTCEEDIRTVTDALWNYGEQYIVHNDLHSINVLVGMVDSTYRCHVIDFEKTFKYDTLSGLLSLSDVRTLEQVMPSHNPFCWHFLRTPIERIRFYDSIGNNSALAKMREYGYQTAQFIIRGLLLESLAGYLKNDRISQGLMSIMEQSVHVHDYMDVERVEKRMLFIWCVLLDGMSELSDVLKKSSYRNEKLEHIHNLETTQLEDELTALHIECTAQQNI